MFTQALSLLSVIFPILGHMDMELPFDDDLLRRYSLGECSEEEGRQIETFLHSLAERQKVDIDWDRIDQDIPARFVKLLEAIHHGEPVDFPVLPKKRPLGRRSLALAIGVFIAVTGISWWVISYVLNYSHPGNYITYTAPVGTAKRIMLGDGSEVTLHGGSSLRYSEQFSTEKVRELWLRGECYFDIPHDSTKTLIVHCGNLLVRDIGTVFNIQADSNTHAVMVGVKSGKVAIQTTKKELIKLVAGQELDIQTQSGKFDVHEIDTSLVGEWFNYFEFDMSSFLTVLNFIESHYHVKVICNEHYRWMDDSELWAHFPNTITLRELLNALKGGPYDFTFRIKGDSVFLHTLPERIRRH